MYKITFNLIFSLIFYFFKPIISLTRIKLQVQKIIFCQFFYLFIVNFGSKRKNIVLRSSSLARGRRYRRLKNDDFQIESSISREGCIRLSISDFMVLASFVPKIGFFGMSYGLVYLSYTIANTTSYNSFLKINLIFLQSRLLGSLGLFGVLKFDHYS